MFTAALLKIARTWKPPRCPLAGEWIRKLWYIYTPEYYSAPYYIHRGFSGGAVVKNPPANAGDARDVGLIRGSGRFPGEGNGNPLWYSCLGNPTDRGA